MALRDGINSNTKYLRVREGKFYIGKDKEKGFGELEGLLVGLHYKDEVYENTPQRKLIVRLQDGEEVYQIGLNVDSQNYTSFISFLKSVDLNENITLHPKVDTGEKDGKEFKKNTILISQDGVFSKGYFTKDNMHGAPEWGKVKVGKKVVIDKSDYLDFMEKFVTENYINKLKAAPKVEAKEAVKAEAEPVSDQLPWEND
jgi:hypothetical protein